MRKYKYHAECVESFQHVIPATQLVIRTLSGAEEVIREIPESCEQFAKGQRVSFATKRALRDFIKAHNGRFAEVA